MQYITDLFKIIRYNNPWLSNNETKLNNELFHINKKKNFILTREVFHRNLESESSWARRIQAV